MANEGSLYVFEGMDGVGKSTVAQRFAEEIDAVYLETPGKGIREIRPYVDSDKHSRQTKFLMYLASNSAVSDQITSYLEAGEDVVLDRYYPTTVAYNEADETEEPGRWFEAAEAFDFLKPDHMFYLWTDHKTRLERKSGRGPEKPQGKDAEQVGSKKLSEQYEKAVDEFNMTPIEAVDGVENVVNKVMEEVGETDV